MSPGSNSTHRLVWEDQEHNEKLVIILEVSHDEEELLPVRWETWKVCENVCEFNISDHEIIIVIICSRMKSV